MIPIEYRDSMVRRVGGTAVRIVSSFLMVDVTGVNWRKPLSV
jgi:hypothetical protein